jgi:hypothetical protein
LKRAENGFTKSDIFCPFLYHFWALVWVFMTALAAISEKSAWLSEKSFVRA